MRLIAPHQTPARRPIAWEECACLLCGGGKHTPVLEAADPLGASRFLVVRCNRCGLSFTNPRPDPDNIERFYPADYHCHQTKERTKEHSHRTPALSKFGLARLLDFGCGAGDFLARMRGQGWSVVGVDRSEAAVELVRDRFGVTAYAGTLPHPQWTSNCFEAITMWQSLEHVHQPLEVLRAAHRLLTPAGRLIVAVPNFAGLASMWFGPHWFGLDLPRHLTHFTPTTLRLMLARAGFDNAQIRQERKNSWIRHSAEKSPSATWTTRLLKTRLGAGIAGWCGQWAGAAECLLAIATK